MQRSHKSRSMKTDERDAEMIRYMHDSRAADEVCISASSALARERRRIASL